MHGMQRAFVHCRAGRKQVVCKAGLREIADNIAQKAGKIATVLGASALVAGVSLLRDKPALQAV